MKYIRKQIIVTAIAVFIGSASFAQGEFVGDKTLSSQQEVTDFNNTSVTGFLSIFGNSITSLEGLSELETVGGNLSITGSMTSLSGLGNLESVGGDLSISNNSSLTSLSALTNLTSAGRFLNIISNTVLLSLEGLNGITNVQALDIHNNPKLSNLNGLNNLESVTVFFLIYSNPELASIQSLRNLTSVGSTEVGSSNRFTIASTKLTSLSGLENLTVLNGNFFIGVFAGITDSGNSLLTNFCAIRQLVTGEDSQVTAEEYNVANNAYNPTRAQLGVATTCLNPTLTATLTLTTQTQIDDLPPHSNIDGDVTIKEADARTITSLSGLTNITSITGNLAILSNMALTSLGGLGNLTALGGELQIGTITGEDASSMPNAALIDFCAISDLVSGDMPQIIKAEDNTNEYFVANNGYNPNYAQLGNMTTCEGITQNGNLMITTEEEIKTAGNIIAITGDLKIKETMIGTITSLNGLANIASITGNLQILNNTALTSLEGLGNLATLGGKLQIGTIDGTSESSMPNMALIDFCAINQLVSGVSQITTTEYFVANNSYNPTLAGLGNNRAEASVGARDGCAKLGTAVVSTNTFSKEEEGYRLFPNPVTDVLFVKSESKITSITISNVSGQEVLKGKRAKINVQNLSKGIYFARIVSGEKTIVEKFVKL